MSRTSVSITDELARARFNVVSSDDGRGRVEIDLERRYAQAGPDGEWHYEIGQSMEVSTALSLAVALVNAAYHATLNGSSGLRADSATANQIRRAAQRLMSSDPEGEPIHG